MIESRALVTDLRSQARELESCMRREVNGWSSDVVSAAWENARGSGHTSADCSTWLAEEVTQAASAWVLATVLARFCEDNQLIDGPFMAGPEGRLSLAVERQQAYIRRHPDLADRDWIVAALDALSTSAATLRMFDSLHGLMRKFPISHEAAKRLIAFWRRLDGTGRLVHDFTDPGLDTQFLADVYADLSEYARTEYALVPTPSFVVEFILDHTVGPAIKTNGQEGLRVIDPACGSGTFLLGAFARILEAWGEAEPGATSWWQIQQSFSSIHGVDKNPIAVVICRFRLLVAAMMAAGADRFAEIPELPMVIATGDSLIPRGSSHESQMYVSYQDLDDYGNPAVNLLGAGSYDIVVGEPPYITLRNRNDAETYRSIYPVCQGKYSLTIPFIVQFFQLARSAGEGAGFVGLLASNSFMKREFGRPLIEEFLSALDITHLLDTSGAYIPGHGTPTVIMLGRSRPPTTHVVRAALGIRGEPSQPRDPAAGVVWQAIIRQIDHPGSNSEWVAVVDTDRALLAKHPWSLADSSTSDLLTAMEVGPRLGRRAARIGYYATTGSDDAFVAPTEVFRRTRTEDDPLVTIITGSEVRDWKIATRSRAFFPGEDAERPIDITRFPGHMRRLWPYRTTLRNRRYRSGSLEIRDRRTWYSWHHVTKAFGVHPWSLTFPWVATHQHFVVLREGIAPLQSAPVLRLPHTASEDEFFQLAAVLNSSAACFWLKQYSQSKGAPRADQLRAEEHWEHFYEFTSTTLEKFPLPAELPQGLGRELDGLAQKLAAIHPAVLCAAAGVPTRGRLDASRDEYQRIFGCLIALQEELDWEVYRGYGLLGDLEAARLMTALDFLPEVKLGERAFEIVMARRIAAGDLETQWFDRHGSTPVTEIPEHWPQPYKDVVAKRIETIERCPDIALMERPEFKRRWQSEPWEIYEREALTDWLLNRCGEQSLWFGSNGQPQTMTLNRLADRLRANADVVSVMRLLAGPRADLADVLKTIIIDKYVPYLAQLRYRESGLRKHTLWKRAWDLQREEDWSGERRDILVPPMYTGADFVKNSYWRLRGKLDVPKESFISYPMVSPDSDNSVLLGWAGWDYLERASAIVAVIEERSAVDNWDANRLVPLLAGLAELMPWVRQWHTEIDDHFGIRPAEAYDAYLATQCDRYGLTKEDLGNWAPPPIRRGRPPKPRPASVADGEAKER